MEYHVKRVKFNKSDSRSTISLDSMKQMLCRLHHPRGVIIKIEIFDDLNAKVIGKKPNGKDILKRTGTDHPLEGDIVEAIYGHSDRLIQAARNYYPDAMKKPDKASQNAEPKSAVLEPGLYYYYDTTGKRSEAVRSGTLKELAKSGEIFPETLIETVVPAKKITDLDFGEKSE